MTRLVYCPGVCRECECTTEAPCPGGCSWVEPDLCSRCAGEDLDDELDGDLEDGGDLYLEEP